MPVRAPSAPPGESDPHANAPDAAAHLHVGLIPRPSLHARPQSVRVVHESGGVPWDRSYEPGAVAAELFVKPGSPDAMRALRSCNSRHSLVAGRNVDAFSSSRENHHLAVNRRAA